MYLTAIHQHISSPNDKLRPALQAHGIDARRLARFTQLALLAGANIELPADSHLILTSPFTSPALFVKSFHALMQSDLPSPLDFIANLHNAATFHVAKHLGIHGMSLFIPGDHNTLWHPLILAINTLQSTPQNDLLIGWLYEAPPHSTENEGCIYWYLSKTPQHQPLATLQLDTQNTADTLEPQPFLQTIQTVSAHIEQGDTLILPAPIPICIDANHPVFQPSAAQ